MATLQDDLNKARKALDEFKATIWADMHLDRLCNWLLNTHNMLKLVNVLLWPLGMRLQKCEHLEPIGREITNIRLNEVSMVSDQTHALGFSYKEAPHMVYEVGTWWELKVWRFITIILTDRQMSRRRLEAPVEHQNCRYTITDAIHPERNGVYDQKPYPSTPNATL